MSLTIVAARAVLLGLALVMATRASAENDFVWDAPAACPDGADVRARIEKRIGRPLDIHGVEVAVTHAGNEYIAHIDPRGVTVANQIRTLTSTRCDDLADAVAVIVTRLVAEWRHGDNEDPPDRHSSWGPVEVRAGHAPAPELPDEGRHWGGGVHASALSGVGTVPGVGVGGEIAVFVRRKNLFAEIGYAQWAPQSAFLVPGAPGHVEVGLDAVTVRAGWAPEHMPLHAWAGTEIGSMFGRGADLEQMQGGSGTYVAVTSGFSVGWPMSPNARLVGTFEVAVPTRAVVFSLADGGDIYRASTGAARCALGLELGWP